MKILKPSAGAGSLFRLVAVSIAFGAHFAAMGAVTADHIRPASFRSGDIQQKSATEWYELSPTTRLRVLFEPGGDYNLTASNTNFPGILWFYVNSGKNYAFTGDFEATVDITGKTLRHDGEAKNQTATYPFAIYGFGYNLLAYYTRTGESDDVYRFYDTKMKVKGYKDRWDWDWIFEGGVVSFAGQDGTNTAGSMTVTYYQAPGTLRNIYDGAESYFTALDIVPKYSNVVFRVDGGKHVNNGYLKIDASAGVAAYSGTNTFEALNGAEVVQKGNVSLGHVDNMDKRTQVYSARGDGTEVKFSGASFTASGHSVVEVADGAVFRASRDDDASQTFDVGTSGTAARNTELVVSGEGTLFDLSYTNLTFQPRGVGTKMTVSDGAVVRLPVKTDACPSSTDEVEIDIMGANTKFLFTGPAAYKTVNFPNSGSLTVNMYDGFFGRDDGVGDYFRFGNAVNSHMTFNMYGGLFLIPGSTTDGQMQLAAYGNSTVNLHGGEWVVSNSVSMISLAGYDEYAKNSLFNMTGGRAYVNGSFTVCASDSATATGEVRLDGGKLELDALTGGNTHAVGQNGTGILTADGGTLKPRQTRVSSTWPFMYNLDYVACGPKGLTIDTQGFDARSMQKTFTNKADAVGMLVKAGAGTFYMQNVESYSVSRTVVRAGTLCLNAYNAADTVDVVELDTALELDGGTFSIGGANSVSNLVV